jgi:hypothetical protein
MLQGVLRYALAILVIAGLFAGPIVAPAWASIEQSAAQSMPDDMPCCPKKAPVAPECQKCPFAAPCGFQAVSVPADFAVGAFFPIVARLQKPANDVFGDSLGHDPPPRPPRFLILTA